MKHGKPLSIFSAALLGLSAAAAFTVFGANSIAAEAADYTYGDFQYSYTAGNPNVTLEKYLGSSTSVTVSGYVPSPDGWKTVSKIGDWAFVTVVPPTGPNRPPSFIPKNVTSVNIPSTVTEIGAGAFINCSTLQTVSLSSNLTKIGENAFENTGLTSVSLPASVSEIETKAFKNTKLTSVTLPAGLTEIASEAFSGCTKLTTVSWPAGLTAISDSAFDGCTKLTSVVLPASVTRIEGCAFDGCTKLNTLEIKGAAYIGGGAFSNCTALTNAKLHKNCTAGAGAFTGCTALNKVKSIVPWSTDSSGKPVLTTNSDVRKLLENVFLKSDNFKFGNDYCDALCNYIVTTETRWWMSDAVKARQLHDWLVRHADYEDELDRNGVQNEALNDEENHTIAGLFISYGLDIRGAGVGETVCEGFAKAYQKLLAKVNIESHVLYAHAKYGFGSHVWNLVKIGNTYYQCDVMQDDKKAHENGTDTSTMGKYYGAFMLSDADMIVEHENYFNPTIVYQNECNNIPAAQIAFQNCSTVSMQDSDGDGLLDSDLNFDGEVNYLDYQVFFSLYYNGDINIDGQVNEQDNYLAQLYNAIFSGAPLTHEIWLWFCIYANIPG